MSDNSGGGGGRRQDPEQSVIYLHTICYSAKDAYQLFFGSPLVWILDICSKLFRLCCCGCCYSGTSSCWNDEWFHWILMMILMPLPLFPQHHPWQMMVGRPWKKQRKRDWTTLESCLHEPNSAPKQMLHHSTPSQFLVSFFVFFV